MSDQNIKPVIFLGSSLRDLKSFPQAARREAGFQIYNVQYGLEPDDWKPMKSVGPGVLEIRIHERGEFRVLYVAKFSEAVYVLHSFHKKTQRTRKRDLDLTRERYKSLLAERNKKNE